MVNPRSISIHYKPVFCKECHGNMIYRGVGEYECENCGALDYDDYGRVRNYIEKNPGSTLTQVSEATGVPRLNIRQLLIEERIEVAPNSAVFLHCARCGTEIRSGMYCPACSERVEREELANEQRMKIRVTQGVAMQPKEVASGEKRFKR